MAFERIELDVNANGVMKTFHAKQFDVGRPIILDLVNGDDAYIPASGVTFELHCRKVDDNIVIISTYEIVGNTLTFASTEQLTACVGKNLATVKMFLDEKEIGTMNFFLDVTIDPDFQGLTSETQIETLYEQVEEITEQVIGDNYYDKTEVDDLLNTKADASTTYTKTEIDTALNLKADKSDTYTKTETNNLLAGKADASDTYSKAQVDSKLSLKADKATTYTKTETDTLLGYKANSADLATVATTGDYDDLLNKPTIPAAQVQSDYAQTDNTQVDYIKNKPDIEGMIADVILDIMPVDTASGPIASFNTALAAPLVNVSSNVLATGGNGTPDNPNPIVGYSSANITRCGVNLFDGTWEIGHRWDGDGSYSSQSDKNAGTPDKMPCKPNTTYAFVMNNIAQTTFMYLSEFDANKTHIQKSSSNTITTGTKYVTFTTGANTYYFAFSLYTNTDLTSTEVSETGINYPSTDTTYHPYNGQTYTIAFGQTVYGGVLDVTRGKLHVTHKEVDLGDLNWINENDLQTGLCRAGAQFTDCVWQSVMICSAYKYNSTTSYNGLSNGDIALTNSESIPLLRIRNTDYSTYTNAQIKTAVTGVKLVYQTKTPFDIDLTPVQIRALVGENNVYSDTNGNTTVKFKDSIQHYIDTKVGS